ncbi:MAG TPA: ImmA/IrrE family metallo-endopeptidase [Burkholderiaceae bacterium]|nr:ImmA/IrrE family metallo-endopeptidase [Burkholderiaceae bacterium]
MELRIIRDELQYAALLEQAKELALSDPMPGSRDAERLAVISVLLEKFEEARFKFEAPDPIEAIVYRLAELGMKQKDFAKIVGSPSRASEVLARKRGLTIEMIRTIHEQLRIPAEILIGHPKQDNFDSTDVDWKKFPVKEMQKRGWFDVDLAEGKSGEQLIRSFFARTSAQSAPVLLRKTLTGVTKEENQYAIYAWVARVLIRARDLKKPEVRYVPGSITDEFLKQLAKLSRSVDGPKIAAEFLAMKGVILVIEPHLPKTKLDGAAMLDQDGTPVIGLTLRYSRVDYFWFTLMHELIHVQRHLSRQSSTFVDEDDLDNEDEREAEANFLAAEAFIPRHIWQASEALKTKRSEAVVKLADSLLIHPSIVAGRIQRETNNYKILKEFGGGQNIKDVFNISPLEDEE